VACKPDIKGRPSLVDRNRVLAIRSVPAEAAPMAEVTYEALYVGPDGAADVADLDWAMCIGRKALSATGPVTAQCLKPKSKQLMAAGVGESVKVAVPDDTCRLFGPTPPVPEPGEPAVRPADPDTTGGYYQPVRLRVIHGDGNDDQYEVGVTRIACGLSGSTADVSVEYAQSYRPNENPAIAKLELRRGSKSEEILAGAKDGVTVKPGEQVTLRVSWASCPTKSTCGDGICGAKEDLVSCPDDCAAPKGCTGSEPYVYFDALARGLQPRRESMRVSWYTNDGRYLYERTGRAQKDAAKTYSENKWTAPKQTGDVLLWVVLRDDRGGVGYESYKLTVAK
jgi:hypothetical protein